LPRSSGSPRPRHPRNPAAHRCKSNNGRANTTSRHRLFMMRWSAAGLRARPMASTRWMPLHGCAAARTGSARIRQRMPDASKCSTRWWRRQQPTFSVCGASSSSCARPRLPRTTPRERHGAGAGQGYRRPWHPCRRLEYRRGCCSRPAATAGRAQGAGEVRGTGHPGSRRIDGEVGQPRRSSDGCKNMHRLAPSWACPPRNDFGSPGGPGQAVPANLQRVPALRG
jgi:hypothetical protein